MIRDAQFGPVIMFGLGGAFIEVLNDVSFRVAPFGRKVALEMILETKASRILRGYRGQPAADLNSVAELLAQVSELAARYTDISEIDLNPVRVTPTGVTILDSRIILKQVASPAAVAPER
jgi:acyl-CoA synthetase (NDP forming)